MQARAVGLVVACRAPAAGASPPRLVVITQADNGKTFRLVAGSRAELHLSGRWIWSNPRRTRQRCRPHLDRLLPESGLQRLDHRVEGTDAGADPLERLAVLQALPRGTRRFAVTIVVRRRA
jgi:hypothetical protein